MKHLKLYEQLDFEDLSDEELFGDEKDLFLGKNGNTLYVLYDPECKSGRFNRYLMYRDRSDYYPSYPRTIFTLNVLPEENSKIGYSSYQGGIHYTTWKNLDPEIKKRIKL